MPTIDADAHVIETDRTWDFMERVRAAVPARATVVAPTRRRAPTCASSGGSAAASSRAASSTSSARARASRRRSSQSIEARLRHMDELGVDVHVLYPTLFLRPVTTHPEVEAALYKSYNRWMADIWSKGKQRLRWAVLAPTMTMDLALREIALGQGARCVRGVHARRRRATRSSAIRTSTRSMPRRAASICRSASTRGTAASTCRISTRRLRDHLAREAQHARRDPRDHHERPAGEVSRSCASGVIETSASWVPYLCHDLAARFARMFDARIDGQDDSARQSRLRRLPDRRRPAVRR